MKCKVTVDTSHYPKEGPWELPEGWVWSSLGDISDYGRCITVPVSDIKESEWILELEDIEKDTGRVLKQIAKRDRSINGNRHFFTKNQILYSKLRTYLNKVLIAPRNGYCTTEIIPISPKIGILPEYLNLVLRSPYFQNYAAQCGYGVKMPRLGTSDALRALIPIPPYKEQQRIIEYADKYTNIIEIIHSEKEQLSDYVTRCKSIILDLAIHGKLVPQDPSDEPAIELLKRIDPDITPSDNLHYEGVLPIGWSLTRLGDVIDIISGTSYHKSDIVQIKSGIRILRGGNIQNGKIVLRDDDVFVHERLSATYLSPCRGDIALVASTGSSELIGKSAIAEIDYPNTQIGAFLRIIRPKAIELAEYLGVIFQSNYYKNHIRDVAKGTNINNIKSIYITDFVVPIPPIDEQRRILQHLKALFTIANQISDSIDESK